MSKQNLRGRVLLRPKRRLPNSHQAHLANRRRRLQFVERMRTRLPSETHRAFGHGTRGNDDDIGALCLYASNLLSPIIDREMVEACTMISRQGRTNFNDPALGLPDPCTMFRSWHKSRPVSSVLGRDVLQKLMAKRPDQLRTTFAGGPRYLKYRTAPTQFLY